MLNIPNQETNYIEFKERFNDDIEKEAVAFLNSDGGKIYIGIKNDGTIAGVTGDVDALLLKIKNRLLDNISPSIMGLCSIETEKIDNRTIIIISLKKGHELLYYIKNKGISESGCFIRIGTSAQPMTRDMIYNLQSRIIPRTLITLESPDQDLEFGDLFIHYKANKKPLDEKTFDKTLDFRTKNGKYNYLAYLMADNNKISIRLGRFYDSDDNFELLEKGIDYGYGCLITGLKKLLDRMGVENITLSKLTGAAERLDKRLVDNKSLREVIINAFMHNDYSTGMLPICEIFQNRFAVRSYGGLLPELTKEAFFDGVSRYRNPEIVRIFKDLDITEGLGFGIRKILKIYDRNIFKFGDEYLYVQLHFDKEVMDSRNENKLKNNSDTKEQGKIESKTEILRLIKENPFITIPELSKRINLSDAGVRKNISILKSDGRIHRIGSNKLGHWEILKDKKK